MPRSSTPTNQRTNTANPPNIHEARHISKRFRAELIGNRNIITGTNLVNRLNEQVLTNAMNELTISTNRYNAS